MKKYVFLFLAITVLLCFGVSAAPAVVGGSGEFNGVLTAKPDENATADDLVTVAARLHGFYNEIVFSEVYDAEKCYDYALNNGLVFDGLFDGDTASYQVSRAEVVYVLGKAVPENQLVPLENLLTMPDSDITSAYYEYALRFINAGVIKGIDKYGSFGPTLPVKRYELNDIINKIVSPEGRTAGNYIEYAADEPFYLINDYLMGDTNPTKGIYSINSGWRYDYTGSVEKACWNITDISDARNGYANTLRDFSTTDNITISREIFPQKDGELVLETSFHITTGFSGFRFFLEDIDEKNIFEIGTYSSGLYFISDGKRTTRYLSYPSSGTYKGDRRYYLYADPWRKNDNLDSVYRLSDQIRMRMHINLDDGTVKIYISGTQYAYSGYTYKLLSGYNGLKKIAFSTGVAEQIEYTVKQVHLYKNYAVNDRFITHKVGSKPYDYTTYGDVTVQEIETDCSNQGDFYSLQLFTCDGDDVYAKKTFKKSSGKVKLETYLLLPTGDDGVYFDVGYDNDSVIRIVTKDHKFYTVDKKGNIDKELRFFTPNTWQCIRIEADTVSRTALIKINGKVVAQNIPFLAKADGFNRIEIGCKEADGDFLFWADDVEVHEIYDDFEDYVPEPVPLDTGDYILSMSVCNLWRNGSHYGWSHIEPHAEIQPITGFYDEGSAEAMDWEIKFLAEHGVSTYAMCWYAPASPAEAPIKKPRMIDAHHEGYFNAKYTEYLDFSIMWENASYGTPGTAEKFKENIFPFWMDWYFSDPRYFRIKEDGKEYLLLTIYQWAGFRNMCLPARSGANASNVMQYYNNIEFNQAEIDAASVIAWMEQQVIEAGYADGIFLCFTNNGSANTGNISMLNMAGSDTAIFPYAWGNTSYNLKTQKQFVETNYEIAQKAYNSLVTEQTGSVKGSEQGLDLLALASVGFNDIGWAHRRYPLISNGDFEELLKWFRDEYMPRYKNDEDSWKQYFIQFDTWNEYGEGHYIYPTIGLDPIPGTEYQGYGQYGYLEAMAKIFGKNYDEDLHKELDIIPTEAQKNRIGRLYVPNKRMFIRRDFLPTTMMETPIPEQKTLSMKFNKADSVNQISWCNGFYTLSNQKMYAYSALEKAVEFNSRPASGTQTNPDPIIVFDEKSLVNGINTADCDVLHIRMKTSKSGSVAQVFFRVDTMPKDKNGNTNYSEDYQYSFHLEQPNVWHDYYIDLNSHTGFTGKIQSIRFDPGSLADNRIYLSDFEFLSFSLEQKRTAITIDSHLYKPTDYWEIQEVGRNEIYIAPTDDNNMYKALHIVYDWNENTGILDLDTPNGTTFRFVDGSDKVLLNGVEKVQLAKKFVVYDGAPVIPLLYILDTAGYKYVHDFENKTLDITVSDPVVYSEFVNANAEDDSITDSFYSINESVVTLETDPDYNNNGVWKVTGKANTDSYFVTDMKYEKGMEYTLVFDLKLDKLEGFEYMGSEYPVKLSMVYDDGTETTTHVMTTGTAYYGKWNHIECTFEIPETVNEDSELEQLIGIFIEHDMGYGVTYYVDNFVVRRLPGVFPFRNGDSEDEDMSMWYSSNTYIRRVYDEEIDSWVIEFAPVEDSGSAWSYLRQGTTFENGVTYYYSFDAKMGVNAYGEEIATTFAINARYVDLLQQHFTQNPHDHSVTYGKVKPISQKDGWKHYTGSFIISSGRTNDGVNKVDGKLMDEITWFVNPKTVDGVYSPMTFRIDNIKFSTSPLE